MTERLEPTSERRNATAQDPQWHVIVIPKIGQLELGLNHPNPAVKAAAKRLLEIPRRKG